MRASVPCLWFDDDLEAALDFYGSVFPDMAVQSVERNPDGGEESQCGWCKDKFGLSWQVVPVQFRELMTAGTAEQSQRVTAAMMTMRKFDVAALQAAFDG